MILVDVQRALAADGAMRANVDIPSNQEGQCKVGWEEYCQYDDVGRCTLLTPLSMSGPPKGDNSADKGLGQRAFRNQNRTFRKCLEGSVKTWQNAKRAICVLFSALDSDTL